MKNILNLFVILVLPMAAGCAFTPQAIELQPDVNVVESAIGQGRVVYVNVVDERARTTLGVRGAGLGADLTLKGDLRTTIRLSTIGGLTRQGFSPTMETVPGARELRVEVRNLDYQVIRGFWQGTLRTTCSLKAICKQGTAREYEKVHNGLYQVGVQVVQSDDRNTRFVNIAVSNALNAMLGDTSLMECLAAPALTTSAAAGAASAPSVAVGKPKQESKRKSKRYATADGKAVAETLAALKALHGQGVLSDEEYMRKQREIINEHTRKTQESLAGYVSPDSGAAASLSGVSSSTTVVPASEKRFRVALFPIVSNSGSAFDGNDVVLYDYAHEYIRKHRDMALVFSAYDSRADWDAAGTAADVWTGSFTRKIPHESSVVRGTKRVGANVALLFAHKKRTAGWYGNNFVVEVYVMDIEKRKTYKMQGDELSYEKTIEAALNRLLSE